LLQTFSVSQWNMRTVLVVAAFLACAAVCAFLAYAAAQGRSSRTMRRMRSASGSAAIEESRQPSLAFVVRGASTVVPQLNRGDVRAQSSPSKPYNNIIAKAGPSLAVGPRYWETQEHADPGILSGKKQMRKDILAGKFLDESEHSEGRDDFQFRALRKEKARKAERRQREERQETAEAAYNLKRWAAATERVLANDYSDGRLDVIFEDCAIYNDDLEDMSDCVARGLASIPKQASFQGPVGGIDWNVFLSELRSASRRSQEKFWQYSVRTYFRIEAPRPRQKNAQVVIVRESAGELTALMQLRSSKARKMPSHLATVGGQRNEEDKDSRATAIREVFEETGLLDVGLVDGAPQWLYKQAVISGAAVPRMFVKYKESHNVDWYVLLLGGAGSFVPARDADACQDISPLVKQLTGLAEANARVAPCFGHAWLSPYSVEHAPERRVTRLMSGLSRSVHQAMVTLVCRGAVSHGFHLEGPKTRSERWDVAMDVASTMKMLHQR